jgi:hypothetical protein
MFSEAYLKYLFVVFALASWQPTHAAVDQPHITIMTMFSGVRIDGATVEWSRGKWSEQSTIDSGWPYASCAERLLFLYPVVGPINVLLSAIDLVLPHLKVIAPNHPRLDIPRHSYLGSIFEQATLFPDSPDLLKTFSLPADDRVVRVVLLVANGSIASVDTLSPRAIVLEFASGVRAGVDMSFGVWGAERHSPSGPMSYANPYVSLLDQ